MKYQKYLWVFLLLLSAPLANAQLAQRAIRNQYVEISTKLGVMIFKLSAETPKHTENFIKLARKGYFDRYTFNRVISGFVIQGGETDSAYAAMEKEGKALQRIAPEFSEKLFHKRGALAAGRDDNKEKSSFLGQFYIADGKKYTDVQLDALEKRMGAGFKLSAAARNAYKEVGGTPNLDFNYTVFGQLVSGWEVLDRIARVKINKGDQPLEELKLKVSILSKKQAKKLDLLD